jgi:hypothetical protein
MDQQFDEGCERNGGVVAIDHGREISVGGARTYESM